MDGLTLLGADKATLKKNAPYLGGGVGALVGLLATRMLFGKYTKQIVHPFGMTVRIRPPVRYALGALAGAGVGAGVGYVVKKKA